MFKKLWLHIELAAGYSKLVKLPGRNNRYCASYPKV